MKIRDILRLLTEDGWYLDRVRGSHHQYKHPIKREVVTVAGQPGDDVPRPMVNSILKQAGLKT